MKNVKNETSVLEIPTFKDVISLIVKRKVDLEISSRKYSELSGIGYDLMRQWENGSKVSDGMQSRVWQIVLSFYLKQSDAEVVTVALCHLFQTTDTEKLKGLLSSFEVE